MKNENLKNHFLISISVLLVLYIANSFVQGTFDPFISTTKEERKVQLMYIFFFQTIANLYYYSTYKIKSEQEENEEIN